MRLFGLIGFPLSHSFSQKYFTEKFEREGITNCKYVNFAIGSMNEFLPLLSQNPDLEGLNVTIPYKEKVVTYLNEMADVAKDIGACNCIKIVKSKLVGYNTDVTGFERSFTQKLKPSHKSALVLGTGGASKAVQYVLAKLQIPFKVVSRSPAANQISYDQVTSRNIYEYNIIINTTPVGMQPHVDTYPSLPYDSLSPDYYLYDLVYNPSKTAFLTLGEKHGATTQNGYDMLVYQAEDSWKIWNT